MLCDVAPLVPVTVIKYVPAGVPLLPLPALLLPPPHPGKTVREANMSRQNNAGNLRGRAGIPRQITAANNVPPVANHKPRRCGFSNFAIVEILRVEV